MVLVQFEPLESCPSVIYLGFAAAWFVVQFRTAARTQALASLHAQGFDGEGKA